MLQFPNDFLWGVSTSAAQVEGAAREGGKGLSVWDVFSRIEGCIADGSTPETACDVYHRFEEDIERMAKMGVGAYRFSFSWPRILPSGTGEVNPEGIAFYKKVIVLCKQKGIKLCATAYHWDLPYALQLKGGFGNREIVGWFRNYIKVLFDYFGDDIDFWATFNEPIATYIGYAKGLFAPGLRDEAYARQALHHLLLCHGEAVRLFRSMGFKHAQIGIVVDVWPHYPAHAENEKECELARFGSECEGYGMFLNPLFLGGYSQYHQAYMREKGIYPVVQEGDFETICQPLDFYGLNFYNAYVDFEDAPNQTPEKKYDAFLDVMKMLKERYHVDIPVYITENGTSDVDEPFKDGQICDDGRIEYTKNTLTRVHQAIAQGYMIKGYFHWSLLDNWEWCIGYTAKYGLVRVDFQTGERTPKKSAFWYEKVIKNNAVE